MTFVIILTFFFLTEGFGSSADADFKFDFTVDNFSPGGIWLTIAAIMDQIVAYMIMTAHRNALKGSLPPPDTTLPGAEGTASARPATSPKEFFCILD